MLRRIFIVIVLFLLQGFLHEPLMASISNLFLDEIESVDRAIVATERRLEAQRKIKNLLLELRHLEEVLMKAEDPKASAARMVTLAEKILAMIQEEHLESTFTPAYLEELRFYSSFARKLQLAPKKE